MLAGGGGSVLVIGLPGVAAEFHAPVSSLSGLGAVLSLGAALALPLATLADRSGRRRLLGLGVAGMSASALASAFAPSLAWLAAARLFGVCFESLTLTVATTLVVESAPAGRRALVISTLTLASGAGIGIATVAYPVVAPHWRVLYAGFAAGGLLFAATWPFLRESAAWRRSPHGGDWSAVLLDAPWRSRLVVLATYSALSTLLMQPALLFAVLFGSRLGLAPAELSAVIVVSGLAGFAGFPIGGWLADRAGRRVPGTILAVATAAIAAATFISVGRGPYWAGNVAWSGLASASTPILATWFAELFPTRARATATACFAVAAAGGGVAGMLLAGAASTRFGLGHTVAAAGIPAAAGALLLLRLPETRGLPLKD